MKVEVYSDLLPPLSLINPIDCVGIRRYSDYPLEADLQRQLCRSFIVLTFTTDIIMTALFTLHY